MTAGISASPAQFENDAGPRTIAHDARNSGGGAMKVFMFHLMPYAHLDMSYKDKYPAAWVVLPNSYFDPVKGHELALLQFGTLPRDLTEKNIRLFAREVLPALQALTDKEYAGLQTQAAE
jgi:hypothetical protein